MRLLRVPWRDATSIHDWFQTFCSKPVSDCHMFFCFGFVPTQSDGWCSQMEWRTPDSWCHCWFYLRLCGLLANAAALAVVRGKWKLPSDGQVYSWEEARGISWFRSIQFWKGDPYEHSHFLTWYGQGNWPSFQALQNLTRDPALASTPLPVGFWPSALQIGTLSLFLKQTCFCSTLTLWSGPTAVAVLLQPPMNRLSSLESLQVATWLACIEDSWTQFLKGFYMNRKHFGLELRTPNFEDYCSTELHLCGALARHPYWGVDQEKQTQLHGGLGNRGPKSAPCGNHQASNIPNWLVPLCHSNGHVSWRANTFQLCTSGLVRLRSAEARAQGRRKGKGKTCGSWESQHRPSKQTTYEPCFEVRDGYGRHGSIKGQKLVNPPGRRGKLLGSDWLWIVSVEVSNFAECPYPGLFG